MKMMPLAVMIQAWPVDKPQQDANELPQISQDVQKRNDYFVRVALLVILVLY